MERERKTLHSRERRRRVGDLGEARQRGMGFGRERAQARREKQGELLEEAELSFEAGAPGSWMERGC